MKKISQLLLLPLSLCFALFAGAQTQEEMKAMMDYATPGTVHKMMARSVGTWNAEISMWMQPGAEAMRTSGTEQTDTILGGRYLQSRNVATFMGMPFEGISTTGYDNAKKVFVNSWIDNMGTGMMYLQGKWDPQTSSITFTGNMVDPMSGKELPVREVWKFVDENTQLFQMYASTGNKEFKNMEIKYTRK